MLVYFMGGREEHEIELRKLPYLLQHMTVRTVKKFSNEHCANEELQDANRTSDYMFSEKIHFPFVKLLYYISSIQSMLKILIHFVGFT